VVTDPVFPSFFLLFGLSRRRARTRPYSEGKPLTKTKDRSILPLPTRDLDPDLLRDTATTAIETRSRGAEPEKKKKATAYSTTAAR